MPEGHTLHRLARLHQRRYGRAPVRVGSPQGRFAEHALLVDGRVLRKADAWGKHLFHHYEGALVVHELAGDASYTLAEFAGALSSATGRDIPYVNLPEAEYRGALVGAGLPGPLADLLADSDAGAAKGALFDDGGALSKLIGRGTVPVADSIAAAVKG